MISSVVEKVKINLVSGIINVQIFKIKDRIIYPTALLLRNSRRVP